MTNEELALHIADGETDLIGELYQQNRGLLYKYAHRFYVLHSERCICAGVTLDDIKPFLATKNQVSANNRALKYLYDQVGVNIKKFKNSTDYSGEVWGTVDEDDEGNIYIIKSVFDKLLEDKGYNSAAFLSWAKERNIIACDYGKRTINKRINGGLLRCVCIRKDMADRNFKPLPDDGYPF